MKKFTILICLYKKNVCDSATIQSMLNNEFINDEFQIYIWDNSPTCLTDEGLKTLKYKFPDFIYRHCPSNEVLSRLYNKVIDEVCDRDGYLILCDDDTKLPSEYFKELIKTSFDKPDIQLFLPKIISDNRIVSPGKNYLLFTRFIKKLPTGLVKSKYMNAINSGMVISNKVFRDGLRYDERLNFYGTDNYFMYHYSLYYESLYILNVEVPHDISFYTSIDIDHKVMLFKEAKRSNKIIYGDSVVKKSTIMLNNFIVGLKFCIKYKTFKFLYD